MQGLVSLPGLPKLPNDLREDWWQTYEQLIDALYAVGYDGSALRVLLSPGASLHEALFICAPQARVTELRRFLAPFTRLETLVPGSAALPTQRGEYDAVADAFPPRRCRIAVTGFGVGDAWLACDFRLAPALGSLLAEANAYGYRLGYQVNISPFEPDASSMRVARTNVLAVRTLRGVPAAVLSLQERLAERLASASAVCDEYVAVDAGEPERWLREALSHQFALSFGNLRFETPSWQFVDGGYDDELACPVLDRSSGRAVDELCATAVDDRELAALLAWRPAEHFTDRFAAPYVPEPPEILDASAAVDGLPVSYDGNERYLFLSYKRSDLGRAVPIVLDLQRRGWRVWYDRGIPGGADWNAMLEERLVSCSGLLLLLSQPALESKYVRREVQFADTLGKPIVGVQMEAAELRHGLALLLNQYQLLSRNAEDFPEQLYRALELISPPSSD